jgi:hypothetical protein
VTQEAKSWSYRKIWADEIGVRCHRAAITDSVRNGIADVSNPAILPEETSVSPVVNLDLPVESEVVSVTAVAPLSPRHPFFGRPRAAEVAAYGDSGSRRQGPP